MAPPKNAAASGGGMSRLGLRLLVAAIMIAVWYFTRNQQPDARPPRQDPPPVVRNDDADRPTQPTEKKPPVANTRTVVEGTLARNVVLRDVEGRTLFRGDVELSPTIDRIAEGKRLERFNNDGIIFQNRERRLPIKPSAYYREWVHPTPEIRGPGPQRIISGSEGDLWYTPDHYSHFFRIRQP